MEIFSFKNDPGTEIFFRWLGTKGQRTAGVLSPLNELAFACAVKTDLESFFGPTGVAFEVHEHFGGGGAGGRDSFLRNVGTSGPVDAVEDEFAEFVASPVPVGVAAGETEGAATAWTVEAPGAVLILTILHPFDS